jgi:predicted MPP superfamily phosphohydrolase
MKNLLLLVVVAGALVTFLYAFAIEPRWLRVRDVEIADSDIPPSFDGKTIAFLTDIHHGPYFSLERVRSLVARTNALQPDLILLGGDYSHMSARYIAPCLAELARLNAPLGKLGVLGNHDHLYDAALTRQSMQRAGIEVLDNDAVWIALGEDRIRVGGVGDFREDSQDLSATTTGVKDEDFVILLSHNPDYVESIQTTAVDLVLSGHTHGGQVTLFGLWAPVTHSDFGQKYRSGVVHTPFTTVIISNGIGTIGLPLRLFARPEIILIHLHAGS